MPIAIAARDFTHGWFTKLSHQLPTSLIESSSHANGFGCSGPGVVGVVGVTSAVGIVGVTGVPPPPPPPLPVS